MSQVVHVSEGLFSDQYLPVRRLAEQRALFVLFEIPGQGEKMITHTSAENECSSAGAEKLCSFKCGILCRLRE